MFISLMHEFCEFCGKKEVAIGSIGQMFKLKVNSGQKFKKDDSRSQKIFQIKLFKHGKTHTRYGLDLKKKMKKFSNYSAKEGFSTFNQNK